MLIFHSPLHREHAPAHEFFRGEKVPCFETPARADTVCEALTAAGHELRQPTADSRPFLSRVHAERYLRFLETAWQQWVALDAANDRIQPFPSVWPVRTLRDDVEPANFIARLGLYSMDDGSPMVGGTWNAAKAAADAAVSAATAVAAGARAAFCATRPPGHHAGPDFMGGYCFLNNAAIAAETLLARGGRRLAILDVDYHHGNGTQAIFYERADVLFVSIHGDPKTEYPFYLGHADETGTGAGAGFNLNLPLPAGSPASAWFTAFDAACERIRRHGPDALVVSAGFDAFVDDPICTFKLTTADFGRVGEGIGRLGCPTVFVLEGGYATQALGLNAAALVAGFEKAV